jgi:hypothetical protein
MRRFRHVLMIQGRSVAVIGFDALRANKIASGRPKDLLDVQLLDEKTQV